MTRTTRRTFLAASAALPVAGCATVPSGSGSVPASSNPRLWYRQPARRWEEALPVGNGRLGAMVFGRERQERLQLNEDTLYAGSRYDPANPAAFAALEDVRRLIAEERYKEAATLAGETMMGQPIRQMPYGTLGDLLVDFEAASEGAPDGYERELDLATGIAGVRFAAPGGLARRQVLASEPDQVVAMQVEGSEGLGFTIGWMPPGRADYGPGSYSGVATSPEQAAADAWGLREERLALPEGMAVEADGPDAILLTGANEEAEGIPSGLRFAMRVTVVTDGKVSASGAGLQVSGATRATVLVAAATSWRGPTDVSGDPLPVVRERTQRAAAKGWAAIRRDAVAAHRELFETLQLDLGGHEAEAVPTDERIARAESGSDPALAALYLHYARYLLIACSRPGTQPANLQGIWNRSVDPPWGSKYTININTEMNYWLAGPGNLAQCAEPLLRMVEELSVTGARTAQTMYRARGWVAHHNTDLWRASAPVDGPEWGLWPTGGAWLVNTLWDVWDYTRDEAMLRRLYPLLRGASLFFLDTLVEDDEGRGLVTSPSISPENQHPFGTAVCAGPAMDSQILRDLFARTADAAERLGLDEDLRGAVMAARDRLPADQIGAQGQLQEWLEDWDAAAPEPEHRHVSHLYAVYPSEQINVRDTPALADAARVTLEARGDISTGWATAWRICLRARLGEGERAHSILNGLLGPKRTYPNMFDAHPPFQIDGNFGGATGILEMLVQDWGDELRLLPALPSAWPDGSLKGLRARGALLVDLDWQGGRAVRAAVQGPAGAEIRLRRGDLLETVMLDARGSWSARW